MHFTAEEQAEIREKMFTEGLQLFKQYGPRRLTVDKLTKSCGIGKGTFYHFYESKEAYLSALEEYCSSHIMMMFAEALDGRKQMTTHEFFCSSVNTCSVITTCCSLCPSRIFYGCSTI